MIPREREPEHERKIGGCPYFPGYESYVFLTSIVLIDEDVMTMHILETDTE